MRSDRIIPILFSFFALLSVFLFASEPVRTWRTKSGGKIEAVWDTSSDTGGEEIRLTKDGKNFRVSVDKLVDEDSAYVMERRAELAEGGAEDLADFIPEEDDDGGQVTTRSTPEGTSSEGDTSDIHPEEAVTAKANRKYAVLVGVDEYEDPALGRLQYTVQDVDIIYGQLLEIGFEKEDIFVLKSRSGAANKPTRRFIQDRIDRVFDLAGPNDMIFLAFTGHGTQIGDTIYFCAEDTYITDKETTQNTAVSVSDVIKRFDRSPTRFKWLVIDACRNDPFSRSSEIPGSRSIQRIDDPPRGSAVMLSCAPGERSYEDKEFEHGLFTYSFVEGLKGAADVDKDGSLTLYELAKYTKEKTESWAEDKFNQSQRPYMTGELSDFIIADGLLRDGLSREVWSEAEGYYQQACLLRRQRHYRDAQREILKALKLTEGASEGSADRQKYLDESSGIEQDLEREEQLEAEKKARQEAERKLREAEARVRRGEGTISTDTPPSRTSKLGVGTRAGEKKTLTVNGIDFTFCWCPAGEFMMGSPESEEGREDDERQHRVRLTKGFWLLESEVTQGQWQGVMGRGADDRPDKDDGKGPDFPMYRVDWNESVEFCRKLSELTGEKIQLPTEAQWEYACRAGTTGSYAGTGKLDEMGWYDDNSGGGTHEVKGKKANAWGLYDMHGNVWEWCSDWYGDYPGGTVTDPTGPDSGSNRVARGGSWLFNAGYCRSASRISNSPTVRINDLGLRPAAVSAD